MDDSHVVGPQARAAAMRLFALAPWDLLDRLTTAVAATPHTALRGPETGLVMLRGRMGATGSAFNTGEATVTRCAVKLADGSEGHAYVLGRNAEHARRAALCDAIHQSEPDRLKRALQEIAQALQAAHQLQAAKAAATRVDFFTMVRGDD